MHIHRCGMENVAHHRARRRQITRAATLQHHFLASVAVQIDGIEAAVDLR